MAIPFVNEAHTSNRPRHIRPNLRVRVFLFQELLLLLNRNSNTDGWPELGRASINVGRMAASVNQLGQIFLESEAISS